MNKTARTILVGAFACVLILSFSGVGGVAASTPEKEAITVTD